MKLTHALSALLVGLCLIISALAQSDDEIFDPSIGPEFCKEEEKNHFWDTTRLACRECKHQDAKDQDDDDNISENGLLVPTSDYLGCECAPGYRLKYPSERPAIDGSVQVIASYFLENTDTLYPGEVEVRTQ
jgi:hypothetical protein